MQLKRIQQAQYGNKCNHSLVNRFCSQFGGGSILPRRDRPQQRPLKKRYRRLSLLPLQMKFDPEMTAGRSNHFPVSHRWNSWKWIPFYID